MPTVVITGASSGIGLACARRLALAGWRVFAGVRNVAGFEAIDGVSALELDVTDEASIARAADTVRAAAGADGLAGLVNNAGIAVGGPLECVTGDELRRQFEVNVLGVAAVTRAFLPLLRTHALKHRNESNRLDLTTIVTVSSVSGMVAFPFLGAYSASKFAVEAMADALRVELAPSQIRVALVQPGPVATPIWGKARAAGDAQAARWGAAAAALYPAYFAMIGTALTQSEGRAVSVDVVTRAVLHALTARRPRPRYPLGPGSRLARLRKFIPDRLWDWMVKGRMKAEG